jgi:hypothetical protein
MRGQVRLQTSEKEESIPISYFPYGTAREWAGSLVKTTEATSFGGCGVREGRRRTSQAWAVTVDASLLRGETCTYTH